MTKNSKGFIPEQLYKKIIESVPLLCVDLVVKRKNSFLLVKRKEDPVKDGWWFPGGRVLLNEGLEAAAKRKLKEEINVNKPLKMNLLGVGETRFKKGRFGKPIHSINIVFLAELDEKQASRIRIDHTSSEYGWFDEIKKNFHPYMINFLKKSKIR